MGERFYSSVSFYFRGNRRCAPRERKVTRTDTEREPCFARKGRTRSLPRKRACFSFDRGERGGDEMEPRWRFFLRFEFVQEEEYENKRDPRFMKGRETTLFPRFFRDRLSHYHKRAGARARVGGHACTADRVILAATLVSRGGGGTPAACITFFIRYRNYLIPRASESVGGAQLQPAVASVRARVRAPARLCISQCAMVLAGVSRVRVPPSVHALWTRGGNTRDADL